MHSNTKYAQSGASRAALTALALLCLAVPARTQESDQKAAHEFDNLVVVANRYERPLNRIGSSVDLIPQLELEDLNQPFLLEAMRLVPGFNLRNNGGPGAVFGMTVRGLNQNRPTVLIDGIEVSNPASAEIINFGTLFTSNLARVEVLKGAQSSLYGANAIAGVINIQTMDGTATPGGQISLGYGSHDTYQGSLSYGGSTEQLSYALNLSHYDSDGYSAQDPSFGPAWADDDGYENTTVSAKFAYAFSRETTARLVLYHNEFSNEFDPGDPTFVWGEPFPDSFTAGSNTFAKIGGSTRLAHNWISDLDLEFSEVQSATTFSAGSPAESNGERIQIDWRNTVHASERWTFVAGAEHETQTDTLANRDRDNQSLFIENVFSLSDQFDWTLGARYDDNEDYGSETTFRATFNYLIENLDTRIHASYGTSFQAPTFFQLSETNGFGNPALSAEAGDGWDLGIEKTFAERGLVIGSTIFGYQIDDKIDWDGSLTSESRPWGTYANRENYSSEGIETSAAWRPINDLQIRMAHTYVSADYNDGTEAERVPRNTSSLSANWSAPNKKINLRATMLYTGSQYTLRGTSRKDPAYTTVNFAGKYTIDENLELWARIDNLFDRSYEEVALYQTPGLSFYGGMKYRF